MSSSSSMGGGRGRGRGRIVMHVDLDYFYAQCEELRRSDLRDKPVVVCVYSARGGDSGAVSTCNYKARAYGVKAGIPIVQAKRLLKDVPDAVFLPVDEPYYTDISEMVMGILRASADAFEQVSIDEAYMDVSMRCSNFDDARELATRLKDEIRGSIGLTCSIGVGMNKLIAKMASEHRKPDGLTVVRPEDVQGFIGPMSVGRLLWVGRRTEERLNAMGIRTIAELANVSIDMLIGEFGRKMGIYLYNASRGIDDEPVKESAMAKQISRITTLKRNTYALQDMLDDLHALSRDVHGSLLEQGLLFRSVGIILVYDDLSMRSKMRTLKYYSGSMDDILRHARALLEEALGEGSRPVRRLGVRVSDLMSVKGQETLQRFM
ncbi:MAG: DNA polymerase IV [Candidatus Nitrosocaldus sp.]|nr:DNA polymerase IV [Candidatus Nitrosocaldus sp.]MDW8000384.1 DNA polymerase IV [Candidatus Nitrosocaldus sp.]